MSEPEKKPRLIPLAEVVFNQPTAVPGSTIMMTTVVPMETRYPGDTKYVCPQPYLDVENDRVIILDRIYPMSRVHFYRTAAAAKSKPQEVDYEPFTIGKRAPKRFKISVDEMTELGPVTKKKDFD